MKVAAQLYTLRELVRDRSQVPAVLGRLREIGYEFVEMASIQPSAAELAAANLGVCATHESLASLTNDLDAVIQRCVEWQCGYVVVPSVPEEYHSAEGFRRFAAEAGDIALELLPHGLELAYHNHDFELRRWDGRTGLEILFDSVAGDHLKAELDTYWLQSAGASPVEWIHRLGSRAKLVHLKDMIDGRQTEVGRGVIDWHAVLGACRDAGTEWLIVEHDDPEGDPLDSLAVSHRNLMEMLRTV
jgi:sugar phosphate isomerase/epimerase